MYGLVVTSFCTSFQLNPDAVEPMADASTSVSLVLTDDIIVSVEKDIEYEMMAELVNVRLDTSSKIFIFLFAVYAIVDRAIPNTRIFEKDKAKTAYFLNA